MNCFSHVPPGFRFHPTDEELVDYYLRKKVASKRIDLDVIRDVDLYKIEPWDLLELCKIGTEDQSDWYFFSHKDKKYPTGTRTNRATKAGFWKATGRDKAIYSKHSLVGMRKTLVFYKGRAPNGQKSDWIMHEYRLETDENGPPQEEGWVVCRVFKKRMPVVRSMGDYDSPCWYDDQSSFRPELDSPRQIPQQYTSSYRHPYPCKQELELRYNNMPHQEALSFLQLPQLESPNSMVPHVYERNSYNNSGCNLQISNLAEEDPMQHLQNQPLRASVYGDSCEQASHDQVTDWRVLDKFVASQLSHDNAGNTKDSNYSNSKVEFQHWGNQMSSSELVKPGVSQYFGSAFSTSCQIELRK